jgi:hypothetical protein
LKSDFSSLQLRRTRRLSALLTGALLTGAGAAHAQTFGTTVVAPSQTVVDQFSTTTTTASPTYNRVAIAAGLNVYSAGNPAASSGIGAAVTYATSPAFTPTATGSYTVNTSATGFDAGNYIQYIYSPALVATTAATALKNVDYGYYPGNTTNSGSYTVNLNGANPYQFVDSGYYSNNATYPQVPGNGFYSEGTATTTVIYNNPGSTSTVPDPSTPTATVPSVPGKVSQTLNVTNASTISAFNSITIDGLSDTFIGDLTATLTHNGVTVDLFDHTGADNNPNDPNYNYGLGSAAKFDGNNYTFALSGASLAAVQDFNEAPDNVSYAASGNAAGGFDPANAGNTLNSFLNQSVFGAWTLNFTDSQGDDTGSFTGFSFEVNNNPNAPVPEASTGLGFGLLLSLIVLGRAGQVLNARRRSAQSAFAE